MLRGRGNMRPIVADIRVSTQKQGASGLGLEAQRDAIIRFADAERYQVTETFSEIETGKGADALDRRPQLAAAIKTARKAKCPIVVSKLDRLSRETIRARAATSPSTRRLPLADRAERTATAGSRRCDG